MRPALRPSNLSYPEHVPQAAPYRARQDDEITKVLDELPSDYPMFVDWRRFVRDALSYLVGGATAVLLSGFFFFLFLIFVVFSVLFMVLSVLVHFCPGLQRCLSKAGYEKLRTADEASSGGATRQMRAGYTAGVPAGVGESRRVKMEAVQQRVLRWLHLGLQNLVLQNQGEIWGEAPSIS